MFDLGFTEILLLGAIALIVLGPEKLPHAARMAGAWYARIRRSISSIQREIEQEVNGLEMKQRVERELASIRAAEQAMRDELNQIQANVQAVASSAELDQIVAEASRAVQHAEQWAVYHPLLDSVRQQLRPPVPYQPRLTTVVNAGSFNADSTAHTSSAHTQNTSPLNLHKPETSQP